MKKDLLDLTVEEMKAFARDLGEKAYRGKQVFQWIHRGAASFDEMTDLPGAFRQKLSREARIGSLELVAVQEDPGDGTRKFLFRPLDGDSMEDSDSNRQLPSEGSSSQGSLPGIESVFMRYSYGNSLCLSTQMGCRMGCRFCASALGGFVRNLTAGEMLAQVRMAEGQTAEQVNHIVLMGMGEPFDNYEEVSRFLRLMHAEEGRKMSWRHMTVSTSGIIPVMDRFAEDFPQVNLAISLHRIENEGRSRLMPVNRRFPVEDLLEAARRYTERTGRRVTFEYALIAGENDRPEDVTSLCRKLGGMLCHVNLIPLNPVEETGFEGSDRRRAYQIADQLQQAGIPATVRRELGSQIDGACGQLRLRKRKTGCPSKPHGVQ